MSLPFVSGSGGALRAGSRRRSRSLEHPASDERRAARRSGSLDESPEAAAGGGRGVYVRRDPVLVRVRHREHLVPHAPHAIDAEEDWPEPVPRSRPHATSSHLTVARAQVLARAGAVPPTPEPTPGGERLPASARRASDAPVAVRTARPQEAVLEMVPLVGRLDPVVEDASRLAVAPFRATGRPNSMWRRVWSRLTSVWFRYRYIRLFCAAAFLFLLLFCGLQLINWLKMIILTINKK